MRYQDFPGVAVETNRVSSFSRGVLRSLDVHGVGRTFRCDRHLYVGMEDDFDAFREDWGAVGLDIANASASWRE